jgi:hypothetical protein
VTDLAGQRLGIVLSQNCVTTAGGKSCDMRGAGSIHAVGILIALKRYARRFRWRRIVSILRHLQTNRTSAIDRRTTRHAGYGVSQRIRKRITIEGIANHADTTPLSMRGDASHAAACVITFLRDQANGSNTPTLATSSVRTWPACSFGARLRRQAHFRLSP